MDTSKSLEARQPDGTDPGAVDNRLSLDPNNEDWKDSIADWEDGQEYTLTVKVTQISPGEYEVNEVTPEEGAEGGGDAESSAEDAAPDEEAEPTGTSTTKVSRPVKRMMSESM